MAQDAPRRRRARPVADAPLGRLLARGDEIAKGWVLALIDEAPLQAAPGILGAGLARDGPRLCDAALRALASDDELARLTSEGALWPLSASVGAMIGADGPTGAARGVDALSAVLWAAVREELRAPDPDLVSALAERLALVCAAIRDAAIEGAVRAASAAVASAPVASAPVASAPVASVPGAGAPAPTVAEMPPVDEAPPAPAEDPPGVVAPPDSPVGDPWSAEPPSGSSPLWMSALADEVRESDSDGRPLALLLAELEDADRVIAAATPERAGGAIENFEAALRGVLRREDILVCEADARAWVIAKGTARAAAHSLGARIAEAVGESAAISGAPLVASVGIAVLGEDGRDGEALVEAAEEARFNASARGIEVSRRVPEHDRG